jgi:hypothetical protein
MKGGEERRGETRKKVREERREVRLGEVDEKRGEESRNEKNVREERGEERLGEDRR